MTLNHKYIKQILISLRDNPAPSMDSYDLAKICGVDMNHIDELAFGKFVTQLRLLKDMACIDCPVDNLGFSQNINRHWIICRTTYRLSSQGHSFLDTENKNTLFNKGKAFFFSAFTEAGKRFLIQAITAIFIVVLATVAANAGLFKISSSHGLANLKNPKERGL
ncbi:MAG: hypothetical protein WDO70_00275 [Alphaproteobacteria bacterium]